MAKIIRLTESDLTKIVKKVIKEQFRNDEVKKLGNFYVLETEQFDYSFVVEKNTHKIYLLIIENNESYEEEHLTPSNSKYKEIINMIHDEMNSGEWFYDKLDKSGKIKPLGYWYSVYVRTFSMNFNVVAQFKHEGIRNVVDPSSVIVFDENLNPVPLPHRLYGKVYDEIEDIFSRRRRPEFNYDDDDE